jgi:hypothetical protein
MSASHRQGRERLWWVLALAGALVAGSGTPAGNAQLRVVHLAAEHAALTVLVDGTPALTALAYGEASEYLVLPAGPHRLAVSAAAIPPLPLDLQAGGCYTAVLLPAGAPPLVLADENLAPMDGPPRLRLVHAAPAAPALALVVGDRTALVRGLAFGAASPYHDAPAGTQPLVVRAANGLAASIPDATLAADTAYTLVAYQPPGDEGLRLLPLVDGYPPLRFAAPYLGVSPGARPR